MLCTQSIRPVRNTNAMKHTKSFKTCQKYDPIKRKIFVIFVIKGQLISKGNFLPKNKLDFLNFCLSLLGQRFFIHFLEELNNQRAVSKLTDLIWTKNFLFSHANRFIETEVHVLKVCTSNWWNPHNQINQGHLDLTWWYFFT